MTKKIAIIGAGSPPKVLGKQCALHVVIERDLLEKITGELTEYALALNGDVCMPTEAAEMMSSKIRVLDLVKQLNHAL